MLSKVNAGGLPGQGSVETTRGEQTNNSELLELAVAILEAPPESAETQDVLQRLDAGDIPFATAIERLRRVAVRHADAELCAAAPARKVPPGR